ncbi:MAG: hypothetical protein EAZ06_11835 [Cytophagales bacterium]|nr:MAG: hypothetical protein EAY69_01820 [Cytophagales bacterium]TAH27966.1 MAG: hypothetical protein EAZ06_11835 [Cytophagales bacterium]
MKKTLFLVCMTFLLSITLVQAQNDNAAEGKSVSELINNTEIVKEKPIEIQKNVVSEVKTAKQIKAENKIIRRQKRTEKFLQSKIGQRLLKYTIKKAEKKRLKKELKNATPEQAKILREQSEQRVKALSGNYRTAAIFAIIGLVLIILANLIKDNNIFYTLGAICLLIALIFVIIELIK